MARPSPVPCFGLWAPESRFQPATRVPMRGALVPAVIRGFGCIQGVQGCLQTLREAADMGFSASPVVSGRLNGAVVVFATTSVAANPMDRAKWMSSGAARRNLACHTGESTIKTSFPPTTFPNRQWLDRAGGRQGRSCCSSASSQMARRTGSVAASDIAACKAGSGDEARRGWDFESDIGIYDLSDHRK